MAANRIAAGGQTTHKRLSEVRCGLCCCCDFLRGARKRSAGKALPAGRLHRMAHGWGGTEKARSTARSTVGVYANGRTSEHVHGAEQDARARRNGAPSFHRADVAPTFRGRTVPFEMIRQFSHSPHAPLTGALLSSGLWRSAPRFGSFWSRCRAILGGGLLLDSSHII